MKKLVILALLLASLVRSSAQTDFTIRYPAVTEAFMDEIQKWELVARNQQYPKDLIQIEGQASDPASALQGAPDYFAVYTSESESIIFLKMEAIPTGPGGIVTFPIHFTDLADGADYYVPFDFQNFAGVFTVAGQQIKMKINFETLQGDRYPSVQLTWGNGAGPGIVGTIRDDLSQAFVESNSRPTDLNLMIRPALPSEFDGLIIEVQVPDEHYELQSSLDFKTWIIENPPSLIRGYTGIHHLVRDSSGHKYFRACLLP